VTDVEGLRRFPLFGGLDDRQLGLLAPVVIKRVVPAAQVVFREGDASTSVYMLMRGSVGTSKRMGLEPAANASTENPKQKLLVHLSAPQFFGEIGLISDLARSATITAETECELLELSRAEFERLANEDPVFGYRMVRNIAAALGQRLQRADLDVLKLTTALSLALGNR